MAAIDSIVNGITYPQLSLDKDTQKNVFYFSKSNFGVESKSLISECKYLVVDVQSVDKLSESVNFVYSYYDQESHMYVSSDKGDIDEKDLSCEHCNNNSICLHNSILFFTDAYKLNRAKTRILLKHQYFGYTDEVKKQISQDILLIIKTSKTFGGVTFEMSSIRNEFEDESEFKVSMQFLEKVEKFKGYSIEDIDLKHITSKDENSVNSFYYLNVLVNAEYES
jgi:hypothetical protein